jgi:glycosyltransferase involved in cell wall biosynthesis
MASLSIIVPFYNEEKYLSQCIQSIIDQTFRDFELLLIDDGSTDNSYAICEKYFYEDRRIKLFHKKNSGLVNSRKYGVRMAKGEFIGFVDADDWIDKDMFQSLLEYEDKSNADIICSGLFRQFGDKDSLIVNNTIKEGIYQKEDLIKFVYPKMIYDGTYFHMGVRPNVVNKLFKREKLCNIINSISDSIVCGEDAAITYSYLSNVDSAYLINKAWYHYRQNNTSISKSRTDRKELLQIYELWKCLSNACNDNKLMAEQLHIYITNMLV